MSSRLSVLLLTVCLLLGLAACSKKPETADNQQQPPATAADNSATQGATQSPANTAPPEQQAQGQAPAAQAETPAPPKPKIVPAGTVIRVRLNQEVGSKVSQTGETFTGSVMDPVVVGGRTLIPAGATVSGEVTDAKSAGHFKGGAELAITIRSVTVGGVPHALSASTVSRVSTGKGKRSAALIGGGAGLGALIGGLAGGGKGAAIGAVAGGGAGTAGAGMTGNREITMPAESAVSFKLTQSLRL